MEKTTRRGFFGLFGKGAAGAAAMAAGIGVDKAHAETEDKSLANFTCSCGDGLAFDVPTELNQVVRLTCAKCQMAWEFTWAGDHFDVRNWPIRKIEAGWNPPAHFNEEAIEDRLKSIEWDRSKPSFRET